MDEPRREAPSLPWPRDNPSRGMPAPLSPPGPPPTPTVKIIGIDHRPARNGGILKAFVDVEINGIVIRSIRLTCQPGGFPQVVMPQISIKPAARPVFFRTVITLPKAMKSALDFEVMSAWKKVLAGQEGEGNGRLDPSTPASM
jgi:hypothetical protein